MIKERRRQFEVHLPNGPPGDENKSKKKKKEKKKKKNNNNNKQEPISLHSSKCSRDAHIYHDVGIMHALAGKSDPTDV